VKIDPELALQPSKSIVFAFLLHAFLNPTGRVKHRTLLMVLWWSPGSIKWMKCRPGNKIFDKLQPHNRIGYVWLIHLFSRHLTQMGLVVNPILVKCPSELICYFILAAPLFYWQSRPV
jgi:hypothetical protein